MNNYDDIINLKPHKSNKYPHMPIDKRAAQFAPFAALTGYNDAINETKRQTQEKIELDEEYKLILNNKLKNIKENINKKEQTTIKYFIKDDKKQGGKYIKETVIIKNIDNINKQLILEDKRKINIDDLIEIE